MEFSVTTVCGPASTDIGRPSLPVLQQPANLAPSPLLASDSFTSSNARCPIERYELDAGTGQFTLF